MKKNLITFLVTILCYQNNIYSQASTSNIFIPIPGTNLPGTTTDFLGWATGASAYLANPSLDIKTVDAMPIDFYANNTYFLSIIAGPLAAGRDGDLDIIQPRNGYEIGDWTAGTNNLVLWHNGNINNIYVGVGAGLTSTGTDNPLVGYNAGPTAGGRYNPLTGYMAGSEP